MRHPEPATRTANGRERGTAGRPGARWLLAGVLVSLGAVFWPVPFWPVPSWPVPGAGAAGSPPAAWAQVSVATVWAHPSSPRQIDAPALAQPARVGQWLGHLSTAGRLGLNGRVDTQVLYGERVLVLGRRGDWSRAQVLAQRGARFPYGIVGWVPSDQLTATSPPGGAHKVIVSAPSTWIYSESRGVVGDRRFPISYDTELPELGAAPGYVLVGLPGGGEGAIADATVAPVRAGAVAGTTIAGQARLFLGLPYLWGGTSAFGFDCSGLVYSVFARYGIILPRDAADQQRAGVPVSLSAARPGDLLFFAGPDGTGNVDHVAIYVGDGQMIDSPYTGASVEDIPVRASPAWSGFAGAVHIAGVE